MESYLLDIFKFCLLVLLLGFSAFFSASETALFSLDSIKIKRLGQEGKSTALIVKLLENPMRCLTTILAGNTLTDVALSSIITALFIHFLGSGALSLSIGLTTFIILIFGEVTPKTIAIHNNEKLSYLVAGPLYVFGRLIAPFLFLATRVCDAIIGFFHLNLKNEPTLTEEEFRTVMEVGHRYGVVGKSEKEMVVSILELTTTTAQEIMTPRTDIRAVSSEWSQERAIEFIRQAKHSKLPVYKGNYDNILGVVYAKELFLESAKAYADLLKPVMFVPATKKISELIKEFYRLKCKMAMVVDEYGGTSGLVTLQDILEEIFGEINDEFKAKEDLVSALESGKFRISGKAPVYRVNEDCALSIPQGDYETIAGYLLDILGKIPQEGEQVRTKDGIFTVEKIMGRRIRSVLLEKK